MSGGSIYWLDPVGPAEALTVAGKPAFASAVVTAEVELQPDATDEVVVPISGVPPSCGPTPAPAGLLIDDLRLE